MNKFDKNWELGSEYHWMDFGEPPDLTFPQKKISYLLGRHSIISLIKYLNKNNESNLWIPDYFCPIVTNYLSKSIKVQVYQDDPRWENPIWNSLRPSKKDIVMAVNYFGIRNGFKWKKWHEINECILLENHSHDPFSSWALNSNAEYCFASLRKTIPIPDGAMLWSPKNFNLPADPSGSNWAGSAYKFAAMTWKKSYLGDSSHTKIKQFYRKWQTEGEEIFNKSNISSMSPWSKAYIDMGIPISWRERKNSNTKYLLSLLKKWKEAKPLFTKWPEGNVPLGFVLIFDNNKNRNFFYKLLLKNKIYCPIHWSFSKKDNKRVWSLSSKILTIPTDQRYCINDIKKITAILNIGEKII